MKERMRFYESIGTRALVALGVSVASVTILAVHVYRGQLDAETERRIDRQGDSYLETYVLESRDSLAKGQPHTFQAVTDSVAKIDGIEQTALYADYGLKTYVSGQLTVGKPFLRTPDGTLRNPNEEIYRKTLGRYRRPDWASVSAIDSPARAENCPEPSKDRSTCGQCHFAIPDDLEWSGVGVARLDRGGRSFFFQRLNADEDCIQCHTYWAPNDTAGYLAVELDTEPILAEAEQSIESTLKVLGVVMVVVTIVIMLVFQILILRPVGRLSTAMLDIAEGDGDLTARLPSTGKGEIAQVARAFNSFADQVEGVIVEVRRSVQGVRGAVSELADGSNRLAEQAEAQAASLQQTSATLEQMTATVGQNAASTVRATEVAEDARRQTDLGSEAMSGVVGSMQEIDEVSQRITKVISTVREVAYRTNLLALNAAIEAARAGEHGRGFGVVAEEVRRLAQHSRSAADEVEKLAQETIVSVREGNQRVETTKLRLDTVLTSIREVDELVSGIATATQQEKVGIEQTSIAVVSLDRTTQLNAQLADSNRQAASALERSAVALDRLVARFRVRDGVDPNELVADLVPDVALSMNESSADRQWASS